MSRPSSWTRIVKRVARSLSDASCVQCRPSSRSSSQWPGIARSSTSSGRSRIDTAPLISARWSCGARSAASAGPTAGACARSASPATHSRLAHLCRPSLAETPPALQGPVSVVWGDPVTYQVDGSVLRRGVLVRWMVNGVSTYSDTIKVSERYSWHAPVWATAGIHKLTIVSISATGRYDSLTKVVTVTAPPGCDGGGSIPVRAEPTDANPVIPRAPVHNSCPP